MPDTNRTLHFSPDDIPQWFWNLIAKAVGSPEKLQELLAQLDRSDLIRFKQEFNEAAIQLTDDPFLSFMDQEISEDGAKDIADWVVSQGKQYFADVWTNPQTIPPCLSEDQESTSLSGIVDNMYWERYKDIIPSRPG